MPDGRADGRLTLCVDSTGIRFRGDGEWQLRKHGSRADANGARCIWPWETGTLDICAMKFTHWQEGDSPVLPELLGQISVDEPLGMKPQASLLEQRRTSALLLQIDGADCHTLTLTLTVHIRLRVL